MRIRFCFIAFFLIFISIISYSEVQNKSENDSESSILGITPEETPKDALEGVNLSKALESFLTKNKIAVQKANLSLTGTDEFAYNIIIDIPAGSELPKTVENKTFQGFNKLQDNTQFQEFDQKNLLIFDFTQEDAFIYKEELVSFIKELKELKLPFDISILLAALDKPPINDYQAISGTMSFVSFLENTDNSAAFTIRFHKSSRTAVLCGCRDSASPLWLTKLTIDSLSAEQIDFTYPHQILSLYRLGLLQSEWRMESFIKNNVPAITLAFTDKIGFSVLKRIVSDYSPKGTGEWDSHYIFFPAHYPLKSFWITEHIFVIACVIVASICVFLLCCFSFVGKSAARNKRDFMRFWHMIPFTILLSFFSLALGQVLTAHLPIFSSLNHFLQFGCKIIFSMIVISAMFAVQEHMRLPVAPFIYGYVISLVSIMNIFIFSAIDILFFVLFATEYIIIYLARASKRLVWLMFWTIMMFVPFLPYVYTLLKYCTIYELQIFAFSSPQGNFLLACAIFPFEIMWLRILLRLNIYVGSRGYNIKKIVKNASISTLVIVLIYVAAFFFMSRSIYKLKNISRRNRNYISLSFENKDSLSAKVTQSSFLGITSNHLSISSSTNPVKYNVRVVSGDNVPVYESSYAYNTNAQTNAVNFIIPDFPPKNITIDYAAADGIKAEITVTAFYRTDDPLKFRGESKTLSVGEIQQ